ncbi:MAG: type II toxin-antitoxin system RelE/ParE family toxin [Methylobacter sp.]|nr:type II toxin-antitoxin system RelE/ParE family toxin [Methylobacter sp.]
MKLSYTRRAKTDLSDIFDYVAQDNTHAAARIITKIRNSLAGLTANPSLGRRRHPRTGYHAYPLHRRVPNTRE